MDWAISDGISEIPIEERAGVEVTHITGVDEKNQLTRVRLTPEGSQAANPAFDVTPRDYVSGIITVRGVCDASETALLNLYPEHVQKQQKSQGQSSLIPGSAVQSITLYNNCYSWSHVLKQAIIQRQSTTTI